MTITYQRLPATVRPLGRRFLLSGEKAGQIVLDAPLLQLWEQADGHSLAELLDRTTLEGAAPETLRAALACLAEAGLLQRKHVEREVRDVELTEEGGQEACENPRLAAIIVTYNSRSWLPDCLGSILAQTYTPIDIILVDNGSQDDTLAWVKEHHPLVRCLALEPASLARAINRGVHAATGADYFLILNPDVRLQPDAVEHLVAVAQAAPSGCAAVAAKLRLMWSPAFLNGLGNFVGRPGWGMDLGLGHLDLGQFDHLHELPSACFAAALVPAQAWEEYGPLDEGLPMYYEDSEWCYRARLLGGSVYAAPQAVVYHAYSGRDPANTPPAMDPRKLQNVTYSRLRFAARIAGSSLFSFLATYWLEDLARLLLAFLRLKWRAITAINRAWQRFWRSLPELKQARRQLSCRRLRSDAALFALQAAAPPPLIWRGLPELTWDAVQNVYLPLFRASPTPASQIRPMPEFPPSSPRLLMISNDVVDTRMAGPGMRYVEMARALQPQVAVTLAIPNATELQVEGVRLVPYNLEQPQLLRELAAEHDVVLISSFILEKFPFLRAVSARLVVDLYDPFVLENLHYYVHEPLELQTSLNEHSIQITNQLAQAGDFFICGNERQRDYWLGVLTTNGRANPHTFAHDPTLRALIDVVGVGLPDRPPQPGAQNAQRYKGVHPQIPAEARIVLWGGGIWDWLDPLSLVRAWPQVLACHPEARLVFLGTRHPNPLVPRHKMAAETERLAQEIGEKDRTILFFEWLPYAERESLLCAADVGVTLHPVHIETRYSIRTRILDYLWARLPVLITEGDITSEWVQQYGLGRVTPQFDVNAVARALCSLLDQPKEQFAAAFTPLHARYQWPKVVEPLRRYCLDGQPAPDRQLGGVTRRLGNSPKSAWGWRYARARYILRHEGLPVLVQRLWRYVHWRFSRPR